MKKTLDEIIKIILFVLSGVATSLLVCGRYTLTKIGVLTVLSTLALGIIFCKFREKECFKKINKKYLLIAFICATYTISKLVKYIGGGTYYLIYVLKTLKIDISAKVSTAVIATGSVPFVTLLIYYLMNKCIPFWKKEYQQIDKIDKIFLVVIGIITFAVSSILYNSTYIYTGNGVDETVDSDIIYTTDSATLIREDVYTNLSAFENDIRQPLFGLFSLPFSIPARAISEVLSFIPNSYYIIFETIQVILLGISVIMIGKLIGISGKNKIPFYIFVFSTFGYIIFSFAYEQYIISLFYLITAIYVGVFNKLEVNYYYIGATGTLLTSGIIFPLITKTENTKKDFLNIFKCCIAFLFTFIISAKILIVPGLVNKYITFKEFTGQNVLFINRLKQFTNFVKSIFIAPAASVINNEAYWLDPVKTISIIGVAILVICLISFIMNRKNKFAKISFLWIIFSFIILCVIGWGTQENGLILYSLYFGWAYISLIYMFVNKIIKNDKIKTGIILLICIVFCLVNISEFIKIFEFGLEFYKII